MRDPHPSAPPAERPEPAGSGGPARLVVVDDSTFVRRTLRRIFRDAPGLSVVGEAGDGAEAIEKIAELAPDLVTLDIQMPGMDGLAALREIKARWPDLPVVVLASATRIGAGAAIEALSLGAIEFIDKSRCSSMDLHLLGTEIIEKVTAALLGRRGVLPAEPSVPPAHRPVTGGVPGDVQIVCIGASTGGPQAIQIVLDRLPRSFPFPVVIVQHMPMGFTGAFAERLNHTSRLEVREADEGTFCRPGCVLIAPAGRHLVLREGRKGVTAGLTGEPSDASHIPSVDVLFSSAAEVFGRTAVGIVLSGMGSDGREGARALARRGAFVVAEAPESCAVYGMPKAIVTAGLAQAVWTLSEIAENLGAAAAGRPLRPRKERPL
ncbi:MAG TPA: chemotaxis-specific protein-glutamate methyltransferase CheB [Thermoanaerobaculia bacterium]|nr:chemotaxis-specific protein-glutamate methyltransferase CheB [Thermoanaerobaculia bacterium]